jgi:hypothetical protein
MSHTDLHKATETAADGSNPTQKSAPYNPGDYFLTGGKLRVYEVGYNKEQGTFGYQWTEKPLNFQPDTTGKLVAPPEGILGVATGYTLEDQASDKISEAKQNPITLGKLSPKSNYRTSGVLKYPKETAMADDSDYVLFEFYDYKPPFAKGASKNKYNQEDQYTSVSSSYSSIVLYMPEDVSTGFRTNWGGKNISNIGAGLLRTAGGGLDKMAANAIETAGDALANTSSMLAAAAISKVVGKLTGDNLTNDDIFGATSGAILNPNTELLFGGVDMRNFQLNFKLVPRSKSEADDINAIIKTFKKAMLPSKNVASSSVLGNISFSVEGGEKEKVGFIGVPKVCLVSFMHGSEEHKKLPKFKMCAITSVDVNYTPDGQYATYKDSGGQPVAIGLALNFQETKICFAEDIEGESAR